MKHAWLVALAICLLVPASADARKECRTPEPPEVEAEEESSSSVHWARGNDSSWVHAADPAWVHADARKAQAGAAESVAYDPTENTGWVHETDYGWWAAVPEAGLNDLSEDEEPFEDDFDDSGEDCTVSKDRNECVALANQVATYRFRLGLAIQREDELWAGNLLATIQRLEARAAQRGCPWVEPSIQEQIVQTVEAVVRAVGVAAQVAAMFHRMGLF